MATAGVRRLFRYRVASYHNDFGICAVEFQEALDTRYVCSWCGGACYSSMNILSCLHAVCDECKPKASSESTPVCPIDRKKLSSDIKYLSTNLSSKQVRCRYVDNGCDFTGELGELNEHLSRSCAFHLTTCSKCGGSVAHKDIRGHYVACKGVAGVFFRSEDVQSLLEDFDSARREVEKALTSTGADDLSALRNAVNLVSEGLAKLRCQTSQDALSQVTADKCEGPGSDV
ncbi:TNF receptor-associated factor 4-like [Amblyomma americanum]